MKRYEMNENWELEEVEDLSNLFIVILKHGSFDSGYTEAYSTDDLEMRAAFDALTKQYEDCGCDELTNIYLIKVPNTAQVVSMVEPTIYGKLNGNTSDPTMLSLLSDVFNRADCEQVAHWAGAGLTEAKKKKKVCSSSYCGFTDPALNIAHFNKCMGTGGLQNPNPPHLVVGDTLPNGPVSDAGSSSSDGASGNSSGEGGAVSESLNESATEKVELEYNDLFICYSGPRGTAIRFSSGWEMGDEGDIIEETINYCYKVPKVYVEADLENLASTLPECQEMSGEELEIYVKENFEKLFDQFYKELLETYRQEAAEEAAEKARYGELTEGMAPVEISDLKLLIQETVDKYNTEATSSLSLVDIDGNDTIEYFPESGEPGKDGHVTEHFAFTVSGGLNGSGEWTNYFNDLSKLARELKSLTKWEPVAVDVNTDVADDVFYVKFHLFNPKAGQTESLHEDLIVIEPFEAKEKLNELVAQIKEQENDEVKKSLLTLLNVYLFQTVGPENREDCDLTEDEWKETSEFAQTETDKYYEEHPEELPGTEEHAAKEDDIEGEEVDESLTEKLDYNTQKAKMQALEDGTRGANVTSMTDEKLVFNRKVCIDCGFTKARKIIEDEMVSRGLIQARVQISLKYNGVHMDENDFDDQDAWFVKSHQTHPVAIIDNIKTNVRVLYANAGYVNQLHATVKGLIAAFIYASLIKDQRLVIELKKYITETYTIEVNELKAFVQEVISKPEVIAKLTTILNNLD